MSSIADKQAIIDELEKALETEDLDQATQNAYRNEIARQKQEIQGIKDNK